MRKVHAGRIRTKESTAPVQGPDNNTGRRADGGAENPGTAPGGFFPFPCRRAGPARSATGLE